MIRRALVFGALGVTFWSLTVTPATAHGVGGRIDLPIPAWQLAWAAGFAVASSFVVLGMFWSTPRLAAAADGSPFPVPAQRIGQVVVPVTRVIGLAGLAVVLYATWWGNVNGFTNIAPIAIFIWFWVGVQILSAVVGDVWQGFNPFHSMADAGAWLRSRLTGTPMSDVSHGAGNQRWAVAAIFSFLWMELCYHSSDSPRSLGVWLTAYTAVMLAGSAFFGRGWVRDADGFGVLFTKLAAIAPIHRDTEGRWRHRSPLAGLATLPVEPGTVTFMLVVLGSTSFDGFTRSSIWLEVGSNRSGWEHTAVNTVGICFVIGVVMLIYRGAIWAMARITGDGEAELSDAFGPSLVPIAMAYAIAHYFSYLALEGQRMIIHLSDPFGRGWDLFGTVDYEVNYTWLSTDAIAWIQTLAIAVGHVLGVTTAHDRAVERYDQATAVRSQYPMLAAMVLYTVAGLFLLLGA